MSNMDAPEIALLDSNIIHKTPVENRVLPAFVSYWKKDMDERNKFKFTRKYDVQNSIFDGDNWTLIK